MGIEIVGIFRYPQSMLKPGNYPDRACEYWIEQKDRKSFVIVQVGVNNLLYDSRARRHSRKEGTR